jgi:sigma-B regulation protein RsbU (phosphoserine phosphatase)
MHPLLKRQLARLNLADRPPSPEEWAAVLDVVAAQYARMEDDHRMLERSLDLATSEMAEAQDRLRRDMTALKGVIAAVNDAVGALRSLPVDQHGDARETRSASLTRLAQTFNAQVDASLATITSLEHSTIVNSVRDGFTHMVEQFNALLVAYTEDEQSRRDREVNVAVQKMLLPAQPLERPRLQAAGITLPAALCGGDWWATSALRDDRCLLVMGDVTGHGLPSALLSAVAKASYDVARAALRPLSLDGLLKLMNIGIIESARRQLFMTACALSFDEQTRELTYANAGHVAPLLLTDRGIQALAQPGGALGMSPQLDVEQASVQLAVGDTIVLYTDGITEARNAFDEEFGEKRLRALLQSLSTTSPAAICDEVLGAVTQFTGGVVEDDQSILVARVVA